MLINEVETVVKRTNKCGHYNVCQDSTVGLISLRSHDLFTKFLIILKSPT